MPGLVEMEHHGSKVETGTWGSEHNVRKSPALPNPGKTRVPDGSIPPQIDGPVEMPNGVSGSHHSVAGNSSSLPRQIASADVDAPGEEPPQLKHITEGYQPLGKLAGRLAQQCFVGIGDLANELVEIDESQDPSQSDIPTVNGASHANSTGTTSVAASARKRLRIIEWANDHRERFIKLLVLSQWCRQVEAVGKLIDLNAWAREQKYLHDQVAWELGVLKRNLHGAKIPNPDIRTALEVLSTGKASWMPDLGYIPPTPLTPQKILKTLRNIDTLLSIRCNLYEDLPSHFKKYSISDGRVTFSVASEFEVDLSIADEDPKSQFFFIDFRFLFSPCSEIPTGQLRFQLEERANHVLAADGLSGCHDFLHNFVLTHKINILRRQAVEMSGQAWTQAIRVEPVHRSLIVQYWIDRPGSKSWIEIGVVSGRRKTGTTASAEKAIPQIAIKWVRDGKATDSSIEFDPSQLSMDRILQSVVNLHISYILDSIRSKLSQTPLFAETTRLLTLTKGEASPDADSPPLLLRFQGIQHDGPVHTLTMEQYTGNLTLMPGLGSSRIENEINRLRDPASEAHTRLLTLLYNNAHSEVEHQAELSGWRVLKAFQSRIKWDEVRRAFGPEVARCNFVRREVWATSAWVVAVGISANGYTWWIVETSTAGSGLSIRTARKIPTRDRHGKAAMVSPAFFANLERIVTLMVSFDIATRELKELQVAHSFYMRNTTSRAESKNLGTPSLLPALFIKFSALMKLPSTHRAWAQEWLKLSHYGAGASGESDSGFTVTHVVTGIMTQPLDLKAGTLQSSDSTSDVVFLPGGPFAVALRSPFGSPWIHQLIARLKGIERLQMISKVLRKNKLTTQTTTLSRVTFAYASDLEAELDFANPTLVRLTFTPPSNPHQRLRTHLAALVNQHPPERGFAALVDALALTLPLLRAFDRLEAVPSSAIPGQQNPQNALSATVHPRALISYRVRYGATCAVDIVLRHRRGGAREWHVTCTLSAATSSRSQRPGNESDAVSAAAQGQSSLPSSEMRNDELTPRLMDLVREKCGAAGWKGLRGAQPGWAASVDGVGDLLDRIDAVVRKFASVGQGVVEEDNGKGKEDAEGAKEPEAERGEGATERDALEIVKVEKKVVGRPGRDASVIELD